MKRLALFTLISVLIIASAISFVKTISRQATYRIMGTKVIITVNEKNPTPHIAAAIRRMREIEKTLNRFDGRSEVSRINRGEKFALSPDTVRCLWLAEKAKGLTSGAFDVYYSGKLNLDGIGKGYAVEEARRMLFKRGVKSAMIDMGSSIAVLGGPYKIGIKHPRKKGVILDIFTAGGVDAISTSGDYEQGHHIIDPKTKKPAMLCQSVTVVTDDAGMADVLSTGIFVLGPKKGLELAKDLSLRLLIVAADGKVYRYNL
ncbi:MAG: FAD:protein FMN transferase [Candidatus Margulisiibacteriota bacterium]